MEFDYENSISDAITTGMSLHTPGVDMPDVVVCVQPEYRVGHPDFFCIFIIKYTYLQDQSIQKKNI